SISAVTASALGLASARVYGCDARRIVSRMGQTCMAGIQSLSCHFAGRMDGRSNARYYAQRQSTRRCQPVRTELSPILYIGGGDSKWHLFRQSCFSWNPVLAHGAREAML